MPKPTSKNTTPPQDFHIDWKSLFSSCPVDIEAQTPEEVKFARRYNLFFWCVYGALAIAALFMAYPDIVKMIMGPLLMLVFFLAFNAIAHSVRVKKRAGRKELAPVASFKECFSNQEFYLTVDRFITANHDETKPMSSVECRALLDYILKKPEYLISGVSLNRLSKLLIKEYGKSGVLSFSTERAISKAMATESDLERIKWFFK